MIVPRWGDSSSTPGSERLAVPLRPPAGRGPGYVENHCNAAPPPTKRLPTAVELVSTHGGIRQAAAASGIAYATLHDRVKSAAARGLMGFKARSARASVWRKTTAGARARTATTAPPNSCSKRPEPRRAIRPPRRPRPQGRLGAPRSGRPRNRQMGQDARGPA
jgi:hypothetical protein